MMNFIDLRQSLKQAKTNEVSGRRCVKVLGDVFKNIFGDLADVQDGADGTVTITVGGLKILLRAEHQWNEIKDISFMAAYLVKPGEKPELVRLAKDCPARFNSLGTVGFGHKSLDTAEKFVEAVMLDAVAKVESIVLTSAAGPLLWVA